MAYSDVQELAHLTDEDVEALGRAFDEIRREIEAKRGQEDADYIRKIIKIQRALAVLPAMIPLSGSSCLKTGNT